jgi:hypothetical protein
MLNGGQWGRGRGSGGKQQKAKAKAKDKRTGFAAFPIVTVVHNDIIGAA